MGTMSRPLQMFLLSVVILTCTHIGATEDDVASLISAAVHEILLPIMKEIKNDLNSVKDDLHSVKDDLNSVKNDSSSLNKTVSNLSGDIEEYKQQTASELAGLQSNVTSGLAGLHTSLQSSTTEQPTQLCEKLRDSLKGDLSSLNDSMNRISDNVEEHDSHVTTELMELDQNLQQNFTLQLKNSYGYITTPPMHTCGGTGGWRRIVYLNFTDPNTPCPYDWRLTSHFKRTCAKASIYTDCDSVTFPVSGGDYTRVCGRIIAYQDDGPDAFWLHNNGYVTTIDGPYVQGVSLTHGNPRQHIWTFAAGYSENSSTYIGACPCDATIDITTPPFVGRDYFCESGYNSGPDIHFFPDDPLWDGDGCTASSTCCSFNNPPYFTKQLSSPTTNDIEARLCHNGHGTPIEFIELYVQ